MAKKGSSKPAKVRVSRITGKQRVARIRNMAVARLAKSRGVKKKPSIKDIMKESRASIASDVLGGSKKSGGGFTSARPKQVKLFNRHGSW